MHFVNEKDLCCFHIVLQELIELGLDTGVEMQKKALQKQIAKSQAGKAAATGANAQKDQDAD